MIEPLGLPAGPQVLEFLPRLAAALTGQAAIQPYAASETALPLPTGYAAPPDDLAVVVGTSGSTGTPKLAMLTAAALRASAAATHERLGGPGQWLLALPAHHIAGLQVLLRSLHAGIDPVVQDLEGGFDPDTFADTVGRLNPTSRSYTSLVPTQLRRILTNPRATDAAATFDALLLGGSALDPSLRADAEAAGLNVVATYGMSETAGGCVYDGVPLAGTTVAVDDEGRVSLGGATLADGYLGRPDLTEVAFHRRDTERWFRTDDHGRLAGGVLHVDGRLDDLINTGGYKVSPRVVEESLRAHGPGIADACVVGLPHPLWGQIVAALIVQNPHDQPARDVSLNDVRAALRGILADHALPQRIRIAQAIPQRGPGKPDRQAVRALLT